MAIERKLPQLPTVERIFCCLPLTVGAFAIALGELAIAALRMALVFLSPNTCAAFEDKYLLYTCLVNIRYFCDELPETYKTVFYLELFLNGMLALAALCLLLGVVLSMRVLVGQYLYWKLILAILRFVSYMINMIPLYKTYTEQDFTIMLWGPLCLILVLYCWLASYSYLESIPIPVRVHKKG